LADVDEAASAGKSSPETTNVDVADIIDLGHAEDGDIEPAAIIKIELLVLVNDRVSVDGGAEIEARGRNAPITPGSAVNVKRSLTNSSAATAATPSGMPIPRFTMAPARSSRAQRLAMILRSSSGIAATLSKGTQISALNAGS